MQCFLCLQNAHGDELRMLRGKTIECISLIGLAVGSEKFMPDAQVGNWCWNVESNTSTSTNYLTACSRCRTLAIEYGFVIFIFDPVAQTSDLIRFD